MCKKAVSEEPFTLKNCLDKHNSQELCGDKVVDACLLLSKFVPYQFVTNKILRDLDNAEISNDDIVFVNVHSDDVTYFSDNIVFVNVDPNNVR